MTWPLLCLLGSCLLTAGPATPTPVHTPDARPGRAFPTAEGFGAYARGGRGGRVVYVTTLEDYPARTRPILGSFRWALEELSEPRTILFRVGGNIALTRRLILVGPAGSFVTIAGQTAPGDGIQLTRYGLVIGNGAHDVVVRYLRIRVGYTGPKDVSIQDAITLVAEPTAPTRNVIVDHCSLEWAMDENVGVGDAVENVTFQWCILGEAAAFAGPGFRPPCAGFLADGAAGLPSDTYVTIHHCLFMSNMYRNPLLSQNGGMVDFVNNVVCNWGHVATDIIPYYDRSPRVNIIGNIYARGEGFLKDVETRPIIVRTVKGRHVEDGTIYVRDNRDGYDAPPLRDDWDVVGDGDSWHLKTPLQASKRRAEPWPVEPRYRVTLEPADVAARRTLAGVGASHPRWDPVDRRLIANTKARKGRMGFGPSLEDHETWPVLAGGRPPTDTDGDGMPDAWELDQRLDPHDPRDGTADPDGDGYTNLEEYLNCLVADPPRHGE